MLSSRAHNILTVAALGFAGLIACAEDDVLPGRLAVLEDATMAECPNGGQVVVIGTDADGNGQLSTGEIESREPVCAGSAGDPGDPGNDGISALLLVEVEMAGANCAEGGVRIQAGADANGNGTLEASEIEQTSFACDGPPGNPGQATLIRTRTATTTLCENGGIVVETGLDLDGNGTLDDPEVRTAEAVCAGGEGETALTTVSDEPAGANCVIGGSRIDVGLDVDGNGTLEPAEINQTEYVCDPVRTAVRVSPELAATSTACPGLGGSRIETGPDTNNNGQLDAAEVTDTAFICSGIDGQQSLVAVTPEPAGANCAAGGNRVDSGVDSNENGSLDAAEVVSTSYVCNGINGTPGAGGNAVRVSSEPAGANCVAGGVRVETGPDTNGNGALDDAEVTSTSFSCQGSSVQTLVTTANEPAGLNCTNGGVRIDQGLDDNANGVLEAIEIDATQFICDTTTGNSVPFVVTTQSLPDAVSIVSYDQELSAVGGTGGDYRWSIVGGALPPNYTLAPTGTPTTRLTGTNTSSGTYTFTVRVTDFFGQTADKSFTLTVTPAPCTPGQNGMVGSTVSRFSTSISVSSEYYVAADNQGSGFVYIGGTTQLERVPKGGGTVEDVETLAGLTTSNLGYEMLIDGDDIYTIDDVTSGTSGRVYRISSDGGATWNVFDAVTFPTAPAEEFRAAEVYDGRIYLLTHEGSSSTPTEIWSFPAGQPSAATAQREVTFSGETSCSGLAVDDDFFYAACSGGERLVRVSRVNGAVTLLTTEYDMSSTNNSLYGVDRDGDGSLDFLYLHTWYEEGYFVCNPAAGVPFINDHFDAGGSSSNYGMGYDGTSRLYIFDDDTDEVVVIQ